MDLVGEVLGNVGCLRGAFFELLGEALVAGVSRVELRGDVVHRGLDTRDGMVDLLLGGGE